MYYFSLNATAEPLTYQPFRCVNYELVILSL